MIHVIGNRSEHAAVFAVVAVEIRTHIGEIRRVIRVGEDRPGSVDRTRIQVIQIVFIIFALHNREVDFRSFLQQPADNIPVDGAQAVKIHAVPHRLLYCRTHFGRLRCRRDRRRGRWLWRGRKRRFGGRRFRRTQRRPQNSCRFRRGCRGRRFCRAWHAHHAWLIRRIWQIRQDGRIGRAGYTRRTERTRQDGRGCRLWRVCRRWHGCRAEFSLLFRVEDRKQRRVFFLDVFFFKRFGFPAALLLSLFGALFCRFLGCGCFCRFRRPCRRGAMGNGRLRLLLRRLKPRSRRGSRQRGLFKQNLLFLRLAVLPRHAEKEHAHHAGRRQTQRHHRCHQLFPGCKRSFLLHGAFLSTRKGQSADCPCFFTRQACLRRR